MVEELCRKISGYRHLKPNWDGEGGETIDERCIVQAKQFVHDIAMATAKKGSSWYPPSVAPFGDGGVDVWWEMEDQDPKSPCCGTYFCPQQYPNIEVVGSDDTEYPTLTVLTSDDAWEAVHTTLKRMDTYSRLKESYQGWEEAGWTVTYDAKWGAVRMSKPIDPEIQNQIDSLCRMQEERKSRTWKARLLKVVQNVVSKIVILLKVRE